MDTSGHEEVCVLEARLCFLQQERVRRALCCFTFPSVIPGQWLSLHRILVGSWEIAENRDRHPSKSWFCSGPRPFPATLTFASQPPHPSPVGLVVGGFLLHAVWSTWIWPESCGCRDMTLLTILLWAVEEVAVTKSLELLTALECNDFWALSKSHWRFLEKNIRIKGC